MKVLKKLTTTALAILMLNSFPAISVQAAESEENAVNSIVTSDYQEAFIDALMNHQSTWNNSQYDCFYFSDLDWDGRFELICDFKASGSAYPMAEAYGFDGTNIFKYKIGKTSETKFLDKKGLYYDVRERTFVWICEHIDTGADFCYQVPSSHYTQYNHWYDYELTAHEKKIYFDYYAGYCGRDGYIYFDRKADVVNGYTPGSFSFNISSSWSKTNYDTHVQRHMQYLYGQDAVHTKYYFRSWSAKSTSAKKQDLQTGYNCFRELNKLRNKDALNAIASESVTPAWKSHYLTQINKFANNKDVNSFKYWLIDFDENGVPELFMDSSYSGNGMIGQNLYSFFNKCCLTTTIGGNWAVYRYKNYLYVEGLRRPVNAPWEYYHVAFQINNGNIVKVFTGKAVLNNGQTFNPNSPNAAKYQYATYDSAFYNVSSYAQLLNLLGKFVDTSKMTRLNINEAYSLSQVRTAIQNYGKTSAPKPAAPSVTLSNKSNGIRAEWKSVNGASKYIVYYKKTSDKSWKSVTTTNLYYPVLNTTAGTSYSVQVQGVASNGSKGNYSKVNSLTFKLSAPTVTLSNKSNGIRADWNKVYGASKYIVYYKKASDKSWKSATTTNNYYPVLNTVAGTKYSVQVQAVASNGSKGYYSAVKTQEFKLMATTVTLSNKSNGIRAEWKKVPGAAKYIVYYRNANTSTWSKAETKNLYYPILNIKKGQKYCVQVQAVASNGAKGYYSKVYSLTFK